MLAQVPTWVYGLFALLLALGLLFTRARAVHPVVPSLMAVGFGCYSLYGVISSFGASLTERGWVSLERERVTVVDTRALSQLVQS